MHHLLHSLIVLAIGGALLLCSASPTLADAGVTIDTTVTVTGGGGGGGFIPPSNGSFPYVPPDWSKIFPQMNQPQSSSPMDNRPVQTNPPIFIPTIAKTVATPSDTTTPVYTPVETTPAMDKAVWAGILFWAIIIGLVVWGLSWVVDKRREKKVQ